MLYPPWHASCLYKLVPDNFWIGQESSSHEKFSHHTGTWDFGRELRSPCWPLFACAADPSPIELQWSHRTTVLGPRRQESLRPDCVSAGAGDTRTARYRITRIGRQAASQITRTHCRVFNGPAFAGPFF